MQLWLVYLIQINEEPTIKLVVNKLTNKEKKEAVEDTRLINTTVVMLTRILLHLKTYLIISFLGPIYHVAIIGK